MRSSLRKAGTQPPVLAWRRLRHPSRYIEGTARYGSRIGVRLRSLVRDDAGVRFQIQLSYSERMCVRILAARCARALLRFSPSEEQEGAGKTGCALPPRSRVQNAQAKTH